MEHDFSGEQLRVQVELEVTSGQTEAKDVVLVKSHYSVAAASIEDEMRQAWAVKLEMIGLWPLKEPTDFPEDQLTAFGLTVGALAIHPYARETVQSTITRTGYPPYALEILHSPVTASQNNEHNETADSLKGSAATG
jgi:preprotein translocase subunit SecB